MYHGAWGVTKALSPLCLSVPICRMRCVAPIGSETPSCWAGEAPCLLSERAVSLSNEPPFLEG